MKEAEETNNSLPLFPHHVQKLINEHGLDIFTIQEAKLWSGSPKTLNYIVNRSDVTCEGIIIPYDDDGDYERVRLDEPLILNGSEAKYLSPTGSKNRLYIPKPVMPVLQDITQTLYFTEGEFKALKATQEGFPCIGLGGIWGFRSEGFLLEDFQQIELRNRKIVIVLDNDADFNFNVVHAGYTLALELTKLGAKLRVLVLPERWEVGDA